MVDLKGKPFFLSEEEIRDLREILGSMSDEEKAGQLFFPIGYSAAPAYLDHEILSRHPGGLMFRSGSRDEIIAAYSYLGEHSAIPMFTAANLEFGGCGIVSEGTFYGTPMQVAAAGDTSRAYELGRICAEEGLAAGCSLAFAPVVDIDMNWRNPITNIRTFGSSADTVIANAREYIRACRERGMLTSVKHFPGDGVDECDQHNLTSVNSLSREEWDETYGRIYRTLIDDGIRAVMAGHIALPAYQSERDRLVPATLSAELLKGLLREELGFNGLIISDATPMVGFCCALDRRTAVPAAIEAGCDMFLFNKDYAEDFRFMLDGLRSGLLSRDRLDEAVTRILAAKFSAGLFRQERPAADQSLIGCSAHRKMAEECAEAAVTLVKDTQQLLPVSAERHRRVLLQVLGGCESEARVTRTFTEEMTARGFDVIPYEREVFDFSGALPFDGAESFRAKYDLVVYLGNVENASNRTTNRISWYTLFGLGNNMPWFVREVPTLFISLQNPYHLVDVPMIGTYINCWSNHDAMIRAAVRKITGESRFTGVSPVDPFCGKDYLRY